ncbi:MAG: GNAT family N-acetyltransferase [Thermomicrobiales bacterium]|nr:GNAT family N-acetyltransferase [Thermomicrobiales bacterium]
MDRSVEYIDFTMVNRSLGAVPKFELPEGYSIRNYRVGEEHLWVDIEMRAGEFFERGPGYAAFDRYFRAEYDWLPETMYFLEHVDQGPVGTTTAWYGDFEGERIGQVHWVAVVPEHQGRGLAKPLLATVLRQLAREHRKAYLSTQTWSWRAVAMYRSFGFTEVIDRPEVERAIEIMNAKLAESRR